MIAFAGPARDCCTGKLRANSDKVTYAPGPFVKELVGKN